MESFQTAIYECPDVNATTMAIDANGRFVLIGGRKCMVLVDLDLNSRLGLNTNINGKQGGTNISSALNKTNATETATASGSNSPYPSEPTAITRLPRNCKYEPTSSHFNYTVPELYAISAYQTVEVYSFDDLNLVRPKLTLRGHSRAIADIEWSHYNPHVLGSAGADCLTNIWDIRDGRRPTTGLTSVSGSTQVRFSKTSPNYLATCHEIDVRVWDIRQPNLPVHYIAAHLQKINGMDWRQAKGNSEHLQQQDQLITCSQDNTIKLWDLCDNKYKPSANNATKTSAWRIRYTPISTNAIVTSSLPQLRSRNECMSMKLWSMKPNRFENKRLELILSLVGHTDVIVDFDWRRRQASSDCEFVSWSKDRTVRVWRFDQQFIEMNVDHSDVDAESGLDAHDTNANLTNDTDEPQTKMGDITATTSKQESGDQARQTRHAKVRRKALRGQGDDTDKGDEDGSEDDDDEDDDDDREDNDSRRVFQDDDERAQCRDEDHDGDDDDDEDDEEGAGLDDDDDDITLYDDPKSVTTLSELKQEFNLINKNIPHIGFEELNALRRVCLVSAHVKNIGCRLRIALPPAYPRLECPTFTIIDSNQYGAESLDKESRQRLLKLLDETARSQLDRGQNCIEPCLRKFVAALQGISSYKRPPSSASGRHLLKNASIDSSGSTGMSGGHGSSMADDPIKLSAQRDHSVPFPPTSGARFCGNLLVCFGRPLIPSMSSVVGGGSVTSGLASTGPSPSPAGGPDSQLGVESTASGGSAASQAASAAPKVNQPTTQSSFLVETPRSMAQLAAHLDNMRRQGSYNLSHISISYFYYGAMRRSELQNARNALGRNNRGEFAHRNKSFLHNQPISKSYKCGPVLVYDISPLLGGISRQLAENYIFDEDVIAMCRRNAEIAAAANRRDLVQVWLLAELSSEGILNSYLESASKNNHSSSLRTIQGDANPNMGMMSVLNSMMMTQQSSNSSSMNSHLDDRPWTMHPFGSKLIQSLIDHYVNNCHDVQTAAMLVWTFSAPKVSSLSQLGQSSLAAGSSLEASSEAAARAAVSPRARHQSELDATTSSDDWSVVVAEPGGSAAIEPSSMNGGSNSWVTDSSQQQDELDTAGGHQRFGAMRPLINTAAAHKPSVQAAAGGKNSPLSFIGLQSHPQAHHQKGGDFHRIDYPKFNILSPSRSLQNDLILHIYADLLYRLNLLNQRAMILKNIGSNSVYSQLFNGNRHDDHHGSSTSPSERLANLTVQCHNDKCRKQCRSVQCTSCKCFALFCGICRLPVRGSSSVCVKCLHGGHVNHFDSWFNDYDFCPTGCGCKCLDLLTQ